MITLTASGAAMLYLTLTLGGLFTLWFIHHFQCKKRIYLPPQEELLVCEYCHTMYSDKTSKTVTKCPACQSYNKSNPFHPTHKS